MDLKTDERNAIVERRQKAIDDLWEKFEIEKRKIILEEMDKDIDLGYDNVYEEHYFDHWRVEEILETVLKEEDNIYVFHDKLFDELDEEENKNE